MSLLVMLATLTLALSLVKFFAYAPIIVLDWLHLPTWLGLALLLALFTWCFGD